MKDEVIEKVRYERWGTAKTPTEKVRIVKIFLHGRHKETFGLESSSVFVEKMIYTRKPVFK